MRRVRGVVRLMRGEGFLTEARRHGGQGTPGAARAAGQERRGLSGKGWEGDEATVSGFNRPIQSSSSPSLGALRLKVLVSVSSVPP